MDFSQSLSPSSVASVLPPPPAIGGGIMDATLSMIVPPPDKEYLNYIFVTEFAKGGLIHTSNFATLKRHNFIYK